MLNSKVWRLAARCRRQQLSSLVAVLFCLVVEISSTAKELPTIIDDPQIGSEKGAIHVVTSSECDSNYLMFQTWAQKHSFDLVKQPGKFTRILHCDTPEVIVKEDLEMMDTLVVPNWRNNPTNGDAYAAYNRPAGLIFWLAERKPTAEWTLMLDPDMLLVQPFLVEAFQVPEGYAYAARYSYMDKGVSSKLVERFLPDVVPREDELSGPKGRRADAVGSFYFMRTKDLVKVAVPYLRQTENLRMDPLASVIFNNDVDKYGQKEWITEMFGYAYGAAEAGIWHYSDEIVQRYPGNGVPDVPILIHYGLNNTVLDYWFDKHHHGSFNPLKCPPWNLDFDRKPEHDAGLFPHPPFPGAIPDMPPRDKIGQLFTIDTISILNQAMCKRHRRVCHDSEELERECGKVDAIAAEVQKAYIRLHQEDKICYDESEECEELASKNDCDKRWNFANNKCRKSCRKCRTYTPSLLFSEDSNRQMTAEGEEKKGEGREKETATATEDTLVVKAGVKTKTTRKKRAENKTIEKADVVATKTVEDTQTQTEDKINKEELLRCVGLDKATFDTDSSCLRLAKNHFQPLQELQDQIHNQDRDQLLRIPSNISLYGLVAVAILFIAFSVVNRRLPFLAGHTGNTKDL